MSGISSGSRAWRSPAAKGLQKRGTLSMGGHAAEDSQAPRMLLLSGKGPVQEAVFEGTGGCGGGGLVAKSCLTLATPWTAACQAPLSVGFQARILEWVAISFSRGIFLTQGSNPGLLHCRQSLYQPGYEGSKGTGHLPNSKP